MDTYTAELSEALVFTNTEPLLIKDVVLSLKALERISSTFLPTALSRLTGYDIEAVEVLVSGFEHGSFKENVVYRLMFRNEASMKRCLDRLREWNIRAAYKEFADGIGSNVSPTTKRTVIVSAALIVLVAGGLYALSVLNGDESEEDRALIEGNNNVVISIGAEIFDKSPAEVREIVAEVVGSNRRRLAQDASDFVAPARREPGSAIQVQGAAKEIAIPADVIQRAPNGDDLDPLEQEETYRDVDLQIRATDLDSVSRGWAGLIPGLIDRRVRLQFADGVDTTKLAGKFSVRADVVVLFRMDDRQGKFRPVQILVLALVEAP